MKKESDCGEITVNLGPALYAKVCQMTGFYGVKKSELMAAGIQLLFFAVTTLSEGQGMRQRDALRTILEMLPTMDDAEMQIIQNDPQMAEAIGFLKKLFGESGESEMKDTTEYGGPDAVDKHEEGGQ